LTNIAFAAIKFKEEHPPAIHWAVAGVLRRAQLSLHSLAVHGFSERFQLWIVLRVMQG
jgi:hypothetical protein